MDSPNEPEISPRLTAAATAWASSSPMNGSYTGITGFMVSERRAPGPPHPLEGPLLDAQRLEVLNHLDRVDAVDQDNRVACSRAYLPEELAVVGEELDVHDAALHDEHLLKVVDLATPGAVEVGMLLIAGLVSEQAELEGRLGGEKKVECSARVSAQMISA